MQLGFVSAILPDLPLPDVLAFAADEGFACVELMCWPPGEAERRYAGVSHVDVTRLEDDQAAAIVELTRRHGVGISGLGYYPNCLHPDAGHRQKVVEHLKRVISAAPKLNVRTVNTFIGRDPAKSIEDNWPLLGQVWPDIVHHAEREGVNLAIENCPMLFTLDEWPGGANLAYAPAVWRALFEAIPTPHLGLNFDPSHLVWLQVDYLRCLREFRDRIYHVHLKDTKVDQERLYEVGILGLGWNTPKIPGYGDVHWGPFFSTLSDIGYQGPVCVEVEDRAFEGSLADRKRALRQSKKYLDQFIS